MSRFSDLKGPKHFTLIIASVLLCVIAVDRVAPFVSPLESLYFRPWQYLSGADRFGLRHTETSVTMPTFGGLANMIGIKQFRHTTENTFTLDSKGHRNPPSQQHVHPEILLVGHSFIAGARNDDDDILSVTLEKRLGVPVSAYAPDNLLTYLSEDDMSKQQPRVIVWGIVERNFTTAGQEVNEFLSAAGDTCRQVAPSSVKLFVKKLIAPFATYAHQSIVRRTLQHAFQELRYAITSTHTPHVTVSKEISGMLYLSKSVRLLGHGYDRRGGDSVVDAMRRAHACVSKEGVSLLVMPIPDKPHVYASRDEGLVQITDDPLLKIIEAVKAQGVDVVNLLPRFQDRVEEGTDIYWYDDTHWNKRGIDEAADIIGDTLLRLKVLD